MAILYGQADTANRVSLPQPAAFCSCNGPECGSVTMDTSKSSHMDENLKQLTSDISCQNDISSDQVPGKSRTAELKAHCAKEIETSKTSAEESDVVKPHHAHDSLMQKKDDYLGGDHWLIVDESDMCFINLAMFWNSHSNNLKRRKISMFYQELMFEIDAAEWRNENDSFTESNIKADRRLLFRKIPPRPNEMMSALERIRNENGIRYPRLGLPCDKAWRIKEIDSEMHELRELLIGGNCGKVQVPPMNPVWLIGQNMTLEENNWEHFLYCYDRGNCGKVQIPAMNPVWTTGKNMTLEEKTWEHILFSYERGNILRNLESFISGEDFDLPVSEKDGYFITGRRYKDTSVSLFISGIIVKGTLLSTLHYFQGVIIACKDAGNEFTVAGSQWNSADDVDEVNGILEADPEENRGDNVENKISENDSDEKFGGYIDIASKLIEADSEGNSGDNVVESLNIEEILSNDKRDTIITSTDNYLAEYNEQTDSLSLAGTHRLNNSFVTFLYEFKSKFFKHLVRKIYSEYRAEVTESVENDNIDYDEEAFDAVGISLKINNIRVVYPSRYTFNDKNDRKTHSVLSEDFEEMSCAVFSAAITPTNEMRFNSSKTVEVIEQSCSNIENIVGLKYKPAVDDDKQIRAVGDEVSNCSSGLATLVTNFFNDNQQQHNNATVAAEGNSYFIETNIKEAESLNERLCNRNKTNPLDKQEDAVDTVDHNGNMAEIIAMSLLSDLTDLPFPQIDPSYLSTLVYRIEEPLLTVIDRLASDNLPTPHISMRYELLRFCTLRTYPRGDKPYLIRLAAAGFYYASDGDGVICYCCGSRRYNWTGREDPMKVHQGIKPNCIFFTKNEDVNAPVVYDGPWPKSLTAIEAIPEPKVITQEGENLNREYAPERKRNQESVNHQQTLGINYAAPKHSQYTIKSQRLGSYKDWPKTSKLKPEELADAGFFYDGFGDCVRCFFCGLGLRHWEDEDNPWIEHARWARTCVFVRQKKGEEFVNLVQFAAVQLSQDNGQAGATVEGSSNTNSLPVSTIEKLLSKAALSAAELGFHTEIIKRAVEEMIRNDVTDNISPDDLLCKVLEIKGRDKRAAASTAGTAASRDTKKGNRNFLHDHVAIKHENEVIKEQLLCKICLDHTVCIVFLPCGHLVTCADCSPGIHTCFICKELVIGTVKANMS